MAPDAIGSMLGIRFAGIADVHLDDRKLHGENGVEYSNRCRRVTGRIEHDARGFLLRRLLNPVDDLALMVRLAKLERQPEAFGSVAAQLLDIAKVRAPIRLRLAGAEQVEVRAVEDVEGLGHEMPCAAGEAE